MEGRKEEEEKKESEEERQKKTEIEDWRRFLLWLLFIFSYLAMFIYSLSRGGLMIIIFILNHEKSYIYVYVCVCVYIYIYAVNIKGEFKGLSEKQ